jgi:hypothetical protein
MSDNALHMKIGAYRKRRATRWEGYRKISNMCCLARDGEDREKDIHQEK